MEQLRKPIHWLDDWLNSITMYRLLLYGLAVLVAIAAVFAFTDTLSISGPGLLLSTAILLAVCYVSNRLLAWAFTAAHNIESSLITALILVLIMPPPTTWQRAIGIAVAGLVAMASKYIIAIHRKHLFNPAAFAALTVGLLGFRHASWWIGTPSMFIFVLVVGLLVVRKIRRFHLFLTFVVVSAATLLLVAISHDMVISHALRDFLLSWPLIFFGTIMLTEPATAPPTNFYRYLYAGLVGVIFASQLQFGPISTSPEVALLIGNVFAWLVSPKYKLRLRLKKTRQLTPQVYEFIFAVPKLPVKYAAGQYMELTMPHHHIDSRGDRRTFTIASSPTENDLRFGVKFYDPSSSFKRTFKDLKPGAFIMAGQLAGDFTLPEKAGQGVVFIAGGIGVTPFRSMLRYLADSNDTRPATLFYLVSNPKETAYKDEFDRITKEHPNVNVVYILGNADAKPAGWDGYIGELSAEIIRKEVADFADHIFFVSGPPPMVRHFKESLPSMGVARRHIRADYFAGY